MRNARFTLPICLLGLFALLGCSTEPPSTSIAGSAVTFTYQSGELRVIASTSSASAAFIKTLIRKKGILQIPEISEGFVAAAVGIQDGKQAAKVEEGATLTFSDHLGISIRDCPTAPTLIATETSIEPPVKLYTYRYPTDCTSAADSSKTLTASATVAMTGQTTKTITAGTVSSSSSGAAPVTLSSIAVTAQSGTSTMNEGTTKQFVATGTYSDNSTATLTDSVTWASSRSDVAEFNHTVGDAAGLITAYVNISSNVHSNISASITIDGITTTSPDFDLTIINTSVLCTELHDQKLLPDAIFLADDAYGTNFIDKKTLRNYHAWGEPLAVWMRRSPLLTKALAPIIRAWAYEMAFRMGAYPESNALGRLLYVVGPPISNALGETIFFFRGGAVSE